jgi:hypothetical protein
LSAVGTAQRRRKTRVLAWKVIRLAWLMVESTVEMEYRFCYTV